MADSTLQDLLNTLTSPAGGDFLYAVDISESNAPKKLTLAGLMGWMMDNNESFSTSTGFKMLQSLNADGLKITNLPSGTDDGDSVRYAQIKPFVKALNTITPQVPVIMDKKAFIRLSTATVQDPWGGFYLFYWCVDTNAQTQITLVGNDLVASSGASVYFDGSVANIVNVPKDTGWSGKYFHAVVRYRNLQNISALSATAHLPITGNTFNDLIRDDPPEKADNLAVTAMENRLFITADDPATPMPGDMYQLELLFDDGASTAITGNEEGLVKMTASRPQFSYDIPLSTGKNSYAHARIVSISLVGAKNATETVHCALSIDTDVLSDTLLNYLALKISERVVTQGDEALKFKV